MLAFYCILRKFQGLSILKKYKFIISWLHRSEVCVILAAFSAPVFTTWKLATEAGIGRFSVESTLKQIQVVGRKFSVMVIELRSHSLAGWSTERLLSGPCMWTPLHLRESSCALHSSQAWKLRYFPILLLLSFASFSTISWLQPEKVLCNYFVITLVSPYLKVCNPITSAKSFAVYHNVSTYHT